MRDFFIWGSTAQSGCLLLFSICETVVTQTRINEFLPLFPPLSSCMELVYTTQVLLHSLGNERCTQVVGATEWQLLNLYQRIHQFSSMAIFIYCFNGKMERRQQGLNLSLLITGSVSLMRMELALQPTQTLTSGPRCHTLSDHQEHLLNKDENIYTL